jgi:hypothetical protein
VAPRGRCVDLDEALDSEDSLSGAIPGPVSSTAISSRKPSGATPADSRIDPRSVNLAAIGQQVQQGPGATDRSASTRPAPRRRSQ